MVRSTRHIRGSAIIILLMGLSVVLLTSVTILSMMLYKKIQDEKKKPAVQVVESGSLYLEYSSMLDDLKKQKEMLTQKEQLLERQSDRILKLEQELQVARKKLENLQDETAINITQMEESEKSNLRKLAKVYSSMDPDQAAPILARLDDDTIANILIRMKERQAAKLLGSFGAQSADAKQRAALISKKIRTITLNLASQE